MSSSFDFSSLSCSSTSDASLIAGYVQSYKSSSAQAWYQSKVLVSSFEGEGCYWGQSSVANGWTYFRSLLTAQGTSIYLMPAIFSGTDTFGSSNSWVDGVFNWNGGWPINTGSNLDFSGDMTYINALNSASKGYLAALSPCFFTYYGPNSYNKDWIYRSDNWLLATRFEQLIANRNSFDLVEVISWNGGFIRLYAADP
jgi:glucan endo-1,3-alpha-glucosidase